MSKNQKRTELQPGVRGIVMLLARGGKKYFFVIMVTTIISSIIPFLNVLLTNKVFTMLENDSPNAQYIFTVLFIIGTLIFVKILYKVFQYFRGNIEFKVLMGLWQSVADKQLDLSYEQITDMETREKMELASQVFDQSRLSKAANNLTTIFRSIFVFAGLSAVILLVGNIMIAVIFLVLFLNTLYLVRVNKKERKLNFNMGDVYNKSRYYNTTSAKPSVIRENKFSRDSNIYLSDYETVRKEKMDYSIRFIKMNNRKSIISLLLHYLLEIAMYAYLGYIFFEVGSISVATFTAMIVAVAQIDIALKEFVNSIISLHDISKYMEKYKEFNELNCKTPNEEEIELKDINIFEFKNVSYKYENTDKYALKNISLTISSADKISVVGKNGAGKTTFVKLLLGLVSPTEGHILFNGKDIRNFNRKSYYNSFSTISQQFQLFPFSVLENITNEEEMDKVRIEDLNDAVNKSGIADKIKTLPQKLETKISREYYADGVEFSGGQMQKIAFARALYKDAPFLVFDEPTSALDPMSEYKVYSEFNKVAKDKMVVYVTHRLSSIKFSNRVVVFEEGKIIGDAPHEKLIKTSEEYKKLYNAQAELYEKGCI